MKRFLPAQILSTFGFLAFAAVPSATAQYSNGQNASLVIGQPNYTANTPAAAQSRLEGPRRAIVDPVSGKLFVVDASNNRILRFSSVSAMASGSAAELVFGQDNFTADGVVDPPTASSLNGPFDATLDSSGNLWVADSGNNRVVRFSGAATVATNNPAAVTFLGQTSATTKTAGTDQFTLSQPTGVALTSTGSLFVSDHSNNRVVRFDSAATLPTGSFASGVLGQDNFLSNAIPFPPTAASLNGNYGITVDSENNLWVADSSNNRALRFNNAAGLANGASASAVVGQASFISVVASNAANGLTGPVSVSTDPYNRLHIADISNNRVVIFQGASSITTNPSASFVLGQSAFGQSAAGATNINTLNLPTGVFFASGSQLLYVTDFVNNRLLAYSLLAGFPKISFSPTKPTLQPNKKRNVKIVLTPATTTGDGFTVKITTPSSFSDEGRVSYTFNGATVSSQVKAGTFETPFLDPGEKAELIASVKALKNTKGKLNFTVTSTSVTNPSATTTKKLTVTVKE